MPITRCESGERRVKGESSSLGGLEAVRSAFIGISNLRFHQGWERRRRKEDFVRAITSDSSIATRDLANFIVGLAEELAGLEETISNLPYDD